jgi:hypothetical protein
MRGDAGDVFDIEIGAQFRRMMEGRIARLESDAAHDEAMLPRLENDDHIRRQMRLVAAQREMAMRIRRFLDQPGNRTDPMAAL